MYRRTPRKNIIFKTSYLIASFTAICYSAYLLIDYIAYGFKAQVNFDDCIVLISSVISLLFEGSIMGFIVRSYKAPTILMKNLVFKQDGTPYVPGLTLIIIGTVLSCAFTCVFFASAYAKSLFDIALRAQCFIASVGLLLFVNLLFCDIFFVTFRHESGSFAII